MGIFGDDWRAAATLEVLAAKDTVIATQAAEIKRLTEQVALLQKHVLALADERVLRAVDPPAPRPPAERVPPRSVRIPPWGQSAIGGGHVDIHAERERVTHRRGNVVEIPDSGPPSNEKPA